MEEAAEHAGDWKKKLFPHPEIYPCPIVDCGGAKIFNQGNSVDWVCSFGGELHYIAYRTAVLWKRSHEDDSITIDEMASHFITVTESKGSFE